MDIHITRNGEPHGPYPEAAAKQMLESGQLLPTDLAWHEGAEGWKPLGEILGAASEASAEKKPDDSEPDDPDKISVTRKGEPIGPYSREKAKEYFASGQLLPTDWGWHDGMDDWKPINVVLGMPVPGQAAAAVGTPGKSKGKKVAMYAGIGVGVAGLLAAGYFFVYPMLQSEGEVDSSDGNGKGEGGALASGDWLPGPADAFKSLNQLSYLGKGLLAYRMDNRERYPAADKWCDEIFNEVGGGKAFISPRAPNASKLNPNAKHCHFAMNAAVAGKSFSSGDVVVLFECDLGWNGSGGLEDAKKFAKDRKATKLAVYFADGSSRLITPDKLDALRWSP